MFINHQNSGLLLYIISLHKRSPKDYLKLAQKANRLSSWKRVITVSSSAADKRSCETSLLEGVVIFTVDCTGRKAVNLLLQCVTFIPLFLLVCNASLSISIRLPGDRQQEAFQRGDTRGEREQILRQKDGK